MAVASVAIQTHDGTSESSDSPCVKGVRRVRVLHGFIVAPGGQERGWALPREGPDLCGKAPDSGMSGSEQAGAAGWVARVR